MGEHDHYQTRKEPPECGPWSPWGAWSEKLLGIRKRSRSRQCRKVWFERFVEASCTDLSVGVQWAWRFRWRHHAWRRRVGPWYREAEWERSFFDPPKRLFRWRYAAFPPVLRGERVRIFTGWVGRVPGVREYRVLFDGEPRSGDFFIETAALAPGVHHLDFDVALEDGATRTHQLAFSVVQPVELAFEEPVVTLRVGRGKPHGVRLKLLLRSNAREAITVPVEVVSVPAGWKAVVLDHPMVTLRPFGRAAVEVGAELLDRTGIPGEEHVPITVGVARSIRFFRRGEWLVRDPSFATGYVRLEYSADYREGMKAILRSNERVRRGREIVEIR